MRASNEGLREQILLARVRLHVRDGNDAAAIELLKTESSDDRLDDRLALARAAMYVRRGNNAAAIKILKQCTGEEEAEAFGDRRGDQSSNPLYLPLVDCGISLRVCNALEQSLGAIVVIDLDRWTPDQIAAVPGIGPGGFKEIKDCLREAGVLEALRERKKLHRSDYFRERKIDLDGSK